MVTLREVRFLVFGLAAVLLLIGCPPKPRKLQTGPVVAAPSRSWGDDLTPEVKAYLERVHAKLAPAWERVIEKAQNWLPANNPANDLSLSATVTVALDRSGQPKEIIVVRRSTHRPFDVSVFHTMKAIVPYPALPPALAEKQVTLRWTLHRGPARAHPFFAEIVTAALPSEVIMAQALEASDAARIGRLLQQHKDTPSTLRMLLDMLANHVMDQRDSPHRLLAVRILPLPALKKALWESQDQQVWNAVLAELVDRKANALLLETLKAAGVPESEEGRQRVLALLAAARKLHVAVPAQQLDKYLAGSSIEIAVAAADLQTDPEALAKTMRQRAALLPLAGPIAVRLRSLGSYRPADEVIDKALASDAAAVPTQEAVCRNKVTALADVVGKVVRNGRASPASRVAGIETLACLQTGTPVLYVALRASDARVQLAAIHALANTPGTPKGASYRLADIAYRSKGKVRAEALAGLARLRHPDFRANVLRRVRLLNGAEQRKVIPALAGYGDEAVPTLEQIVKNSKDAALQRAVAAALAAIGTPRAKQARSALPLDPEPHPAEGEQAFSMESLLRFASSLRPADY